MRATTQLWICLLIAVPWVAAQTLPVSGPSAEKRFPPLKLPAGFKATLYAADPMVEYPSAVALGPRRGTLFVAADYMTGLGLDIIRRDEIRLLEDADHDGYADNASVFAKGFNSIQGLTYQDGTLYVMHAPLLTALRDTKGSGQADERVDLLSGLGLPPEKNPPRLHCANGLVMGHDGWLYLALGDHGCSVPRTGKDNLVLNGGGILRCRADGSNLHVFASGLRNIYDVALDEDLNVFVRDNENDGGDYMIRVCHSFFGADHGYPYLYYEHPDEALTPLADLGRGSSAGGLCYLETLFPPEYRGNLFFCEWGKSVVRHRLEKSGSGFAKLKEEEFATGAPSDPYPFKPTDVVVDHDGALIVVDWADGQRPKRGRARIYRITPAAKADSAPKPARGLLDAESYYQRAAAQAALLRRGQQGAKVLRDAMHQGALGTRGRMHAVWVLAQVNHSVRELLDIVRADAEPRVQVQAVRALVDLADPALGGSRQEAPKLAEELADFGADKDPHVRREVIVALGRLQWAQTPQRLKSLLGKSDPALEHAAQQALRSCDNWPAVLKLLDQPGQETTRVVALRALADCAEPLVVDGLMERLLKDQEGSRRLAYADLLTRVHHKAGPWVYWGYRPPPRPPHTHAWERTSAIASALDRVLADPDRKVRLAILKRMQREKIPIVPNTLSRWLREERQPEQAATILEALRPQSGTDVSAALLVTVRAKDHAAANRLLALAILAEQRGKKSQDWLLELASRDLDDGPVLADVYKRLAPKHQGKLADVLQGKLASTSPEVRTCALEILAGQGSAAAVRAVPHLLEDADARVRRAAAMAAGTLAVRPASALLLKRCSDVDPHVRRASFDALLRLKEQRVVPLAVAAVADAATELSALKCITQLGSPEHAQAVTDFAKRSVSADILATAVRGLTSWSSRADVPETIRTGLNRAVADVQGTSGSLVRWQVVGPLPDMDVKLPTMALTPAAAFVVDDARKTWQTLFAEGPDARLNLSRSEQGTWLGFSDVLMADATTVQFLASSSGAYRVWVNGRPAFQREVVQADADRFTIKLDKGVNRVAFLVTAVKKDAELQLRFRRVSSRAEHERLIEAALTRKGNPDRGRSVFQAMEKSQCLKCHRLNNQGERIGPDLTGVGDRFSRIYLVESILEPSRTIAPSFDSAVIELKDGRLLTGIAIAETETTLTLADNQGQKQALAKSAIVERRRHPLSTMPEGLEQRLSLDEFVDLIAFLAGQKAR